MQILSGTSHLLIPAAERVTGHVLFAAEQRRPMIVMSEVKLYVGGFRPADKVAVSRMTLAVWSGSHD